MYLEKDIIKQIEMEKNNLKMQKLANVLCSWMDMQLVNHGLRSSILEKLKSEITEFYKLPLEEKMKYKMRAGDVEGYGLSVIRSEDQKIDWGDRFYMITNPIHRRKPHLFPELLPSLRFSIIIIFFQLYINMHVFFLILILLQG